MNAMQFCKQQLVFSLPALVDLITNFRKLQPREPPKNPDIKLYSGAFYHSKDPAVPEVDV